MFGPRRIHLLYWDGYVGCRKYCCFTYMKLPHSRSTQVELGKVEGSEANTGQVFECWAASSETIQLRHVNNDEIMLDQPAPSRVSWQNFYTTWKKIPLTSIIFLFILLKSVWTKTVWWQHSLKHHLLFFPLCRSCTRQERKSGEQTRASLSTSSATGAFLSSDKVRLLA